MQSCSITPTTYQRLRKGALAFLSLSVLVTAHWFMIHSYVRFCAPPGFMGIFQTALGMGSPICSFLMTMHQRTTELYLAIWVSFALMVWNFGIAIYDYDWKKKN
jgi:hypothetical protein